MTDVVQNVVARLDADISSWQAGMARAEAAVQRTAAAAERASTRTTAAQRNQAAGAEQAADRTTRAQRRQARESERAASQQARAHQQARAAANATAARATTAAQQMIAAHQRVGTAATAGATVQATAGRTASQIAQQTAAATAGAASRAVASNRAMATAMSGMSTVSGRMLATVGSAARGSASAIANAATTAARATGSGLASAWSGISRGATTAWSAATSAATSGATAMANAARAAGSGVAQGWVATGNSLGRFRDGFLNAGAAASSFSGTAGTIGGRVRSVVRPFEAAATATRTFTRNLTTLNDQRLSGLNSMSGTVGKVGLVMAGMAGLTVKAAMDWESAWTGVTKTVDGTPAELKAVENGLRGLAKSMPTNHTELAAVAENAGQLGVKTKDIVGFTKTMVQLGDTTNLTADEAATNIAQISNIMGTMDREGSKGVERFGATLVALGNDGASTEKEILSMAQRMAGAVKTLGGSESDLLALSNTLASMGIRAELGGGVATRALLKMSSAVDGGGEKLTAFAKISGVSADEFAAKFKTSPMEALDMVAKGLGRVTAEGGNVTAALADLGMKGTEEKQVMLALASSGDLLSDSLKLGGEAWKKNAALAEEANKRYATASSKVKVAWNTIKDAAITAGGAIMPVVAGIAEAISGLASWFGSLPTGVQGAIGAFGLFAGGALLAIAGAGKLVVGLNSVRTSAQMMGITMKTASIAAGVATGVLAIAAIGLTVWATNAANAKASTDEFKGTLDDLGGATNETMSLINTKLTENKRQWFDFGGKDWTLIDRAKEYGLAMEDVTGYVAGNAEATKRLEDGLHSYQEAREGSVGAEREGYTNSKGYLGLLDELRGSLSDAQRATIQKMEADKAAGVEAGKNADGTQKSTAALQEEAEATAKVQAAAQRAAQAEADHADAMGALSYNADQSARSLNEVYDAMTKVANAAIAAENAELGYYDTIAQAEKTAKENKDKGVKATTEAGRANKSALLSMASSTLTYATAAGTASEAQKRVTDGRAAFLELAKTMGVAPEEAKKLADSLHLIPDEVYVAFSAETGDMATQLKSIKKMMDDVPKGKSITINENSPDVIAGLEALGYKVTHLEDGKIQVTQTGAEVTGKQIDAVAEKQRIAKVNAGQGYDDASRWLDGIARNRVATISVSKEVTTHYKETAERTYSATGGNPAAQKAGKALGGRLPAHAAGHRLPTSGPGTDRVDGFLGVDESGWPLARVNRGEWVVNGATSARFDGFLGALNAGDPRAEAAASLSGLYGGGRAGGLPGLAGGGKASEASKKAKERAKEIAREKAEQRFQMARDRARGEWSASSIRASGGGLGVADQLFEASKNDVLSKSRRRQLGAQARRMERLSVSYDKKTEANLARIAAEREKKADLKSKISSISNSQFDLRRQKARGEIGESFKSGNGLAVVDQMYSQARSGDLSKKQADKLYKAAGLMEKKVLDLQKKQAAQDKKMEAAQSKQADLQQARDSVKSQITGAFSLTSLAGQKDDWGHTKTAGKSGLLSYAKKMAAGVKKLQGKIDALRKKGFPPGIIQQAIDEWSSSQTFEIADALLSMNKTETTQMTSAFKDMEKYAGFTGDRFTESMAAGGLKAANALVSSLNSQQKALDKSAASLGKSATTSLDNALVKSKATHKTGIHAIDGTIAGIKSKQGDLNRAMDKAAREAWKAMNKAWGVKSPARKFMPTGGFAMLGAAKGVENETPALIKSMRGAAGAGLSAMQEAMDAPVRTPQYRVPASREVTAHAAAVGGSAYTVNIDYDRLAAAMAARPVALSVNGRQAGAIVQEGNRFGGNNK